MKDLPPVTAAATTSKRWRREIEEEIGEEGENGEAVELLGKRGACRGCGRRRLWRRDLGVTVGRIFRKKQWYRHALCAVSLPP